MFHTLNVNGSFFVEIVCDDCDESGEVFPAKSATDEDARKQALDSAVSVGFVEEIANGRRRHYCRNCKEMN